LHEVLYNFSSPIEQRGITFKTLVEEAFKRLRSHKAANVTSAARVTRVYDQQ